MRDITEVLRELREVPYVEREISVPHTGYLHLADVKEGDGVLAPEGKWKEKRGTLLATLVREKNPLEICSEEKGVLREIRYHLDGTFVEAGTVFAVVRHYLTQEEVVSILLRKSLFSFCAPEHARYFFSPELDKKIKIRGCRSVTVHDGMELFIVSKMKRETPLCYSGPEGIIYDVCFDSSKNVSAGSPLVVVCPEDRQSAVEEVIARVHWEWKEGN